MLETKKDMNGWGEWGRHILLELEGNKTEHKQITEKLDKLIVKLAIVETKMAVRASVTGMVSGGVMSVIVAMIVWLITK